ncbi:hypothetical protein NBRC13296_12675 [Paenibacillus chitinolyticus]|uniref:hypothetical protein n=1 Tax=Paenibacillus chitinolyticus TaxID=79263 RepID=UPI0035585424
MKTDGTEVAQLFEMNDIDSRLRHLNHDQINKLISRYYDGEKIEILLKEYQISARASELYKMFPATIENIKCFYCNVHLVTMMPSRTSNAKNYAFCPHCDHKETPLCRCTNCKKLEQEKILSENQYKKIKIAETYDIANYKSNQINDLNLRDVLYLACLLRSRLDENFSIIQPLENYIESITPTSDKTKELVLSLANKKIIVPHSSSPINSFKEDEDFPNTYYIYRVNYQVNVEEELSVLLNPDSTIFLNDPHFVYKMWREIALEETKQYLLYSMKKVKFDFSIGDKTISVFNDLLDHFSTSQIHALIYRGVSNATRYYQEGQVPKQQAANSVITNCQRLGEKAIAENWDVKGFNRNYDLPQSVLSELFFNRILKIGSRGFDEVPDILIDS